MAPDSSDAGDDDARLSPIDDERWMVINGRRWRRTDPILDDTLVAALKSHLGRGRSAVPAAKRAGDADRLAAARWRTNLAKHGLGERGPKWWDEDEADRIDRARSALAELDASDTSPAGADTAH